MTNPGDYYSFLLSSHYDTVEFSAGASSDGTGVAVMLELLENVVNTVDNVIKYPVIFFFGGGSEYNFEATKEFMKNHEWSKKCLRFINMDSSGSGGKSMVFRVTDNSILNEYNDAPHPYISVIGEEVMKLKTNYDTDFTVFSDKTYRNQTNTLPKYYLKGYDYGYFWDGYFYGTQYDTYDRISRGTLQHLGDNVLHQLMKVVTDDNIMSGTVTNDAESNYLADEVYFDVLGGFYVHFSFQLSQAIQGIIVVVDVILPIVLIIVDHMISLRYHDTSSVYQLFKKSISGLQARLLLIFLYFCSYGLSLGFGILLAALTGSIVDGINAMPWYRDPVLAVFLFSTPTLLGMFISQFGVHLIINAAISSCGCFKMYRISLKSKSELKRGENTAAQTLIYAADKERYLALTLFWGLLTAVSLMTQLKSFYIVYFWSFCLSGMLVLLLVVDRVIMWSYMIIRNQTRAKALEAAGADMSEELTSAGDNVDKRKKFLELRRAKKKDDELSKEDEKYLGKLAAKRNMRHEIAAKLKEFSIRDFFHAVHYHQLYWVIVMSIACWPPATVTIDILDRMIHLIIPLMSRASYPVCGAMIGSVIGLLIYLLTISYMPIMHRAANWGKAMILTGIVIAIVGITAVSMSGFQKYSPRKVRFTQVNKVGPLDKDEISTIPYPMAATSTAPLKFDQSSSLATFTMESFDGIGITGLLNRFKGNYGANGGFFREYCKDSKCEFIIRRPGAESFKALEYHLHLNQLTIANYGTQTENDETIASFDLTLTLKEGITLADYTGSLSGDGTLQKFQLASSDPNYNNVLFYVDDSKTSKTIHKFGAPHTTTTISASVRYKTASTTKPTLSFNVQLYDCDLNASEVVKKFNDLYVNGMYYVTPLGSTSCKLVTEQSTINIQL